jgi:lysophospholipase L1-like esterase
VLLRSIKSSINPNNNIVEIGVNEGRRTKRTGRRREYPNTLEKTVEEQQEKEKRTATMNQQHPPAHYDG